MDVLEEHGMDPTMVVIDHNNEETVREVLDRGYWAAFTIYPNTKMGNERMVEIVKEYGTDRIIVNSAADWGVSDPLTVPKTAALMLPKRVDRKRRPPDLLPKCADRLRQKRGDDGSRLGRWIRGGPKCAL